MKWISESEVLIGNKVYHITNPEWIKNLEELMDKKDDNDPTAHKEAAESP